MCRHEKLLSRARTFRVRKFTRSVVHGDSFVHGGMIMQPNASPPPSPELVRAPPPSPEWVRASPPSAATPASRRRLGKGWALARSKIHARLLVARALHVAPAIALLNCYNRSQEYLRKLRHGVKGLHRLADALSDVKVNNQAKEWSKRLGAGVGANGAGIPDSATDIDGDGKRYGIDIDGDGIIDAVTNVTTEKVLANEEYWQQGDASLYTEASLRQRSALRRHKLVLDACYEFWKLVLHTTGMTIAHPATTERIALREAYEAIFLRAYRLLLEDWDADDAAQCIAADWFDDTKAGDGLGLNYSAFCDALFMVADIWTRSIDGEEYADFLWRLYQGIARADPPRFKQMDEVRFDASFEMRSEGRKASAFTILARLDGLKRKAATKIANLRRRQLARREAAERKLAVEKVQTNVRVKMGRKRAQERRQEKESNAAEEKKARATKARLEAEEEKRAVLNIQKNARAAFARKRAQERAQEKQMLTEFLQQRRTAPVLIEAAPAVDWCPLQLIELRHVEDWPQLTRRRHVTPQRRPRRVQPGPSAHGRRVSAAGLSPTAAFVRDGHGVALQASPTDSSWNEVPRLYSRWSKLRTDVREEQFREDAREWLSDCDPHRFPQPPEGVAPGLGITSPRRQYYQAPPEVPPRRELLMSQFLVAAKASDGEPYSKDPSERLPPLAEQEGRHKSPRVVKFSALPRLSPRDQPPIPGYVRRPVGHADSILVKLPNSTAEGSAAKGTQLPVLPIGSILLSLAAGAEVREPL